MFQVPFLITVSLSRILLTVATMIHSVFLLIDSHTSAAVI